NNSVGFEKGAKRPVISFINAEGCLERETSNVSQLNTFADLTVDCGIGNPGAVGLRFIANNSGKIENVSVIGNDSDTGIQLAVGCEGVFRNITVSGFDTGVYAYKTSVCVLDDFCFTDISGATVRAGRGSAAFQRFSEKDLERIEFIEENGNYAILGDSLPAGFAGNTVYSVDNFGSVYQNGCHIGNVENAEYIGNPEDKCVFTAGSCAVVEDCGAVGDGKTDSTAAIQRAFNSGRETVLFSGGHYLVNGSIKVPSTVKRIDFMFCDFFAGESLVSGKVPALFDVCENSDNLLTIKNLYTFEQFYGHFRLIAHNAKRDILLEDLHTQTAAMYYNTVPGSRVYLDNCACTVGTYSNDCIISRKGFKPEFCNVIPYEFHGQTVTAFNLNPERADIEVLNDNSLLSVCGFKVEGPGTAIKTVNGGKTEVFVFSCGIGDITAKNALFVNVDSDVYLVGGKIFGVTDNLDYNLILDSKIGEKHKKVYKKELPKVTKYRVDYTLIDKR
ncbi:MAG: hypothetical protein J5852_04795, partial [Clostridia bacterium]|nr:hypothetical protein [Clostridia bacterium]